MKLRVELLSRIIENKYSMGGTARFAVFRFAQSATRDILLDENLGSSNFVKRMNDLTWLNEGSFLDRGLNEVERYSGVNTLCPASEFRYSEVFEILIESRVHSKILRNDPISVVGHEC